MRFRSLAGWAMLMLAALLTGCGGGSGRSGTDVVVTGSGPTTQILRGQSVVFQMTVANTGDGDANDVAIRGGVAYPLVQDSITCSASGSVSCPASLLSPMSIPSLPPGSSLTFQITAHLANGGTGTVPVATTMSASVSGDFDNTNNTATVNATAYYSSAAVTVTGLAPGGTAAGGSPAQFVMTVSNAGPDAATNLSIRDIPESISQATITCAATGAAVCPTSLNAHGDPMTVTQLNVGDTLQFTVTGTAPSSPRGQTLSIGNKLSVSLDNDTDTSDNTVDTLGTAYTAESGVYAAGTGPTSPVAAGSTANFAMTVKNAGPDAAAGMQIRDNVDSSLVLQSITCQAAGAAICPDLSAQPFQGGTLPGDDASSLTFNVSAQVKTGYNGTFHNTLVVTTTNDPNTADNTATAQGTSYAEDLTVAGTAPTGPVSSGSVATFTMTVTNNGPGTATSVAIGDTVSAGLALGTITCQASGGAVCPSVLGASMTASTMPTGSVLTFSVPATVSAGTSGVVSNTMTASAAGESKPVDNTATARVNAVSLAAVSVSGVAPAGTVAGGSTAQFVMTVSNAGPNTATNLSIRDVPENLSQPSITCSATGTAVCPTSLNTHGDAMTVAQLKAGDKLQFTVTGTAPSTPRGQNLSIGNKLSVTLDNDTDTSDNSADALGTAYSAASGVFAAGTGPTSAVPAGSTANFTMTVANAGPDAATGVQIRDSVDSALILKAITCQAVGGAVCPDLSVQPFQGAVLPANGELVFNVGAQVKSGYNGTFHNTLTVSATNDTSTADNTATVEGTAASEDLKVTGSASSGPVSSGSTAAFTMTVTNSGPATATDVAITDTVSASLTLGAITCQAGGGATCPASLGATMSAPTIPASGTLTFTVHATVSAGASGAVSNTMTATAAGEAAPADNTATATVNAVSADLGVSETAASSTVNAGSSAVFTAVVANPGPNTANNITVVESLSPAGYGATVTCEPSSGASCPGTLGQSLVIPSLHPGDYLKFTYTVPVSSVQRDLITSTVQISADGDSNTANNTATASTQAIDANSGQYTVFAADGHQYLLTVDFDRLTYTMSGNGKVWNETLTGPTNGDYLVSGSQIARLHLASDLIVGGHDFGTGEGVLPYVAARSFVTSLLQAQGAYDLATRNVSATSASTHAGTASISSNTLSICQTDSGVQRTSACGGSLVSYALSLSGNVFTGVNTVDSSDVYSFVIARTGALTLMLSASTALDGTQQLRIGVPDSSGLVGGANLRGPSTRSTTGDWVTVSIPNQTTYSFSSLQGDSGSATLALISSGGPFAMRDGNLLSQPVNSQLIYVLQAYPVEVTVGDFSHGPSGLLQITLP